MLLLYNLHEKMPPGLFCFGFFCMFAPIFLHVYVSELRSGFTNVVLNIPDILFILRHVVLA